MVQRLYWFESKKVRNLNYYSIRKKLLIFNTLIVNKTTVKILQQQKC